MRVYALATFLFFAYITPASAVIYTVDNSSDNGSLTACTAAPNDCSLRGAVAAAQASTESDMIRFNPDITYITLNGTEITFSGTPSLSIQGNGGTTINGGPGTNRIFSFREASVGISKLILVGGGGAGSAYNGFGGSVMVAGGSFSAIDLLITGNSAGVSGGGGMALIDVPAAVVINTTFSNNRSGFGGGLFAEGGSVGVTNSTFSANSAVVYGGGIYHGSPGTMTLRNVTVASNNASTGGGIFRDGGTVELANTISAQNFGTNPDVSGTFTTLGFNLIGNGTGCVGITNGFQGDLVGGAVAPINARLGGLQNNGGLTPTRALLSGSLAINTGSNALATGFSFDQRGMGFPRIVDIVDRGAYEYNPTFVTDRVIDFDGDSKTDLSIFRPTSGEWWYNRSSDNGSRVFMFGTSTDRLVPGEYTDDSKTDIAFWRPSTGVWFVLRSENSTFFSFPFGIGGDKQAPADFDGDGRHDAAVFRPSEASWYIRNSSNGSTTFVTFGAASDIPMPADYDGDGKADVAIFRPSNGQWWWRRSSDLVVQAVTFGVSTDRPVPGDYTGDARADIAFWRSGTGEWFVLRSEDFSYYAAVFGISTDVAVPGDYDGDGRNDLAVYRPSNATWYVLRSTGGNLIQTFGAAGDKPVPSAYVPVLE